jgi:predicted TIM-barrel fold metal-dependent hydrolase
MIQVKKLPEKPMQVRDAHCHFFSANFFKTLGVQAGLETDDGLEVVEKLGWEYPGTDTDLAKKWIQELDKNDVAQAALISSIPGDETSVTAAVDLFPERIIGAFMTNPVQDDVGKLAEYHLQKKMSMACLFPAMHHFQLDGNEVLALFEKAASTGSVVFVHCGILSVGVRKKLGLASDFDIRLGNPLDLQRAATAFPDVPIMIPHFGAGYWQQALMLASLHENVYMDTSSSNSWMKIFPGVTLKEVFQTSLDVLGSGRLVFGSDSSFFPRGWQSSLHENQKDVLEELGLHQNEKAAILGDNFSHLFPG